jgi:hypothetical protein
MQCANHPDREPVGACVSCGKFICMECRNMIGGKTYCQPCSDKLFAHQTGEKVHPTSAALDVTPHPKETQPVVVNINPVATDAKSVTQASTSTSGQGSASTLPPEIRGWNWGAFFLNWIWGIGNSVWIAFLVFIPLLNIVWCFMLGAKGNEWAWQHKKWDSIEHFKKTQRTWSKWGVILFFVSIALYIIYVIIALVISGVFSLLNN